jgi:hypothetical protein
MEQRTFNERLRKNEKQLKTLKQELALPYQIHGSPQIEALMPQPRTKI